LYLPLTPLKRASEKMPVISPASLKLIPAKPSWLRRSKLLTLSGRQSPFISIFRLATAHPEGTPLPASIFIARPPGLFVAGCTHYSNKQTKLR
jgi:hypothetical protein